MAQRADAGAETADGIHGGHAGPPRVRCLLVIDDGDVGLCDGWEGGEAGGGAGEKEECEGLAWQVLRGAKAVGGCLDACIWVWDLEVCVFIYIMLCYNI